VNCRCDGVFSRVAVAHSSQGQGHKSHIHVAHAGTYAKLGLDPVSVGDVRGFRANEMTEIRRIVVENGQFFLERWYEYFDGED